MIAQEARARASIIDDVWAPGVVTDASIHAMDFHVRDLGVPKCFMVIRGHEVKCLLAPAEKKEARRKHG